MDETLKSKSARYAILVMVGILLLRLLNLGDIALVDSTEGRYGSIPLRMVMTGNWITPYIPMDTGWEPFWGKPPLAFWLSAVALKIFGYGEWAVRLPSVVSAAVMVWLSVVVGRAVFGATVGLLSGVILASSGMVLYLSGAVVLDVTLAATIAGAFAAFILHIQAASRKRQLIFGLLLFLSFGLGVLTKGPIAVIFPVGSIVLWSLITRSYGWIKTVPWFSGTALFLLVTVPWFWAAEEATPGFLHYFFVNEHYLRYVTRDYGDKYGSGHVYRYGTVWVFAILAFLPWTPPLLYSVIKGGRALFRGASDARSLSVLLACWALVPLGFFTMARQLIAPYVIPCLPAMAILTAALIVRVAECGGARWLSRYLMGFSVLAGVVVASVCGFAFVVGAELIDFVIALALGTTIFSVYFASKREPPGIFFSVVLIGWVMAAGFAASSQLLAGYISDRRSTRSIVAAVRAGDPDQSASVTVLFGNPFSVYFYTQVDANHPLEVISREIDTVKVEESPNVLIKGKDLQKLPPEIASRYKQQDSIGAWVWLRSNEVAPISKGG